MDYKFISDKKARELTSHLHDETRQIWEETFEKIEALEQKVLKEAEISKNDLIDYPIRSANVKLIALDKLHRHLHQKYCIEEQRVSKERK